jgi:chorismate mutase
MILNNSKITQIFDNISDIRSYLYYFENPILKLYNDEFYNDPNDQSVYTNNYKNNISHLLTDNVRCSNSNIIINVDNEIFDITKNSLIMCFIHKRLSISELVADVKFNINPYEFLLKNNDFYKLVTDRYVERGILQRINSDYKLDNLENNYDFFIKIMELSKQIQSKYLEKYIQTIKIGYMGNQATFSYEVISNYFNGLHISCESIEDIYNKLNKNSIQFGLVPIYNSLIGSLFMVPNNFKSIGNIDHKIKLALFANNSNIVIKNNDNLILYVQEIVYKEAKHYIENNFKNIKIILCKTTEESCIKCITDKTSMTIASTNNKCNFLNLIEDNIVDHNITTFSFIKKNII